MTTFETNALEINDLNKNYPGFSLNHLNLTLPSGCILGLIGENGAGKTTTIKLILDIIIQDQIWGRVTQNRHKKRQRFDSNFGKRLHFCYYFLERRNWRCIR